MDMKQKIILYLMLFFSLSVSAQQGIALKGNIVNTQTKEPIAGVLITLKGQSQTTTTDSEGKFQFTNVTTGADVLSLTSSNIVSREIPLNIGEQSVTLNDIKVVVTGMTDNASYATVTDELLMDDDVESSSQLVSSMLILSNDVYLKNVGFQLSPARFKVRGYDSYYEQKFINGVSFNDQLRGVFNFASIGALNDLTRNGDVINYNNAGTFTFGSIGGAENINMRAGSYAKGGKISASYTNRNYYLRGMASYSTGLRDDGWAFTAAIGGRYSDEGVVDGTFYRNVSYALGVEKQWAGGNHSISFTTFGSPVQRGQQGASFQEVYDLVGDNLYNPNWGYQNGKKRNSRVVKAYDPTAIVSHIWKINRNTTLNTGLGVHYGRYGGTALNWYDAPDPRPDYYRKLPSYYESSEEVFDLYTKAWRSKNPAITQLNWDKLYEINEQANRLGDGNAFYMLEERRSDLFEGSFNSTLNTIVHDNMRITAGIGLRSTESKQFKTVNDLLGAKYVLDIDKFAERDDQGNSEIIQNDLNRPDRKVYEGDKFGYDFRLNVNSANVWIQNQYTTSNLDFYYGTKLTYTDFQRNGKMKNGRYPTSSYGKGEKHSFVDFAFKTGLTYKITGRHFITANISYATEAPLPNNAYVSPRITDNTAADLKSGKILSMDLNYVFSLPSLNGRVSVYQTNFYDQMGRKSYYHDAERTFVNHMLMDMNKINRGFEIGLAYRLNTNWSFDLAGTVAQYYYSNNPDGIISYENGLKEDVHEKVYLKNYYVGSTPQIAGTFGINYFYDYWFLGINVNAFGKNYIDVAPLRRLASNYESVNPYDPTTSEAYKVLTDQERYGSACTFDASIGKIFYLPNKQSVNFNFSFNNIFNRKNIKTGGYEQGRLDLSAPRKFASKYYYMQGFNCFLNASYKF
jgi:hypothetical protein